MLLWVNCICLWLIVVTFSHLQSDMLFLLQPTLIANIYIIWMKRYSKNQPFASRNISGWVLYDHSQNVYTELNLTTF